LCKWVTFELRNTGTKINGGGQREDKTMIELVDDSYTDKEFCAMFKIDRATSLRWREQKIVGYLKLPNGQIRYLREHIEELRKRHEQKAAKSKAA
jgi:hypothetical protein